MAAARALPKLVRFGHCGEVVPGITIPMKNSAILQEHVHRVCDCLFGKLSRTSYGQHNFKGRSQEELQAMRRWFKTAVLDPEMPVVVEIASIFLAENIFSDNRNKQLLSTCCALSIIAGCSACGEEVYLAAAELALLYLVLNRMQFDMQYMSNLLLFIKLFGYDQCHLSGPFTPFAVACIGRCYLSEPCSLEIARANELALPEFVLDADKVVKLLNVIDTDLCRGDNELHELCQRLGRIS